MKLSVILFFVSFIQLMATEAYAQFTRLTLQFKDATVKEILNQIEDNSEFFFLYNGKLIDVDRKVSMDVKNEKISEILSSIFKEADVAYTVVDRQIVLTNKADQNSFTEVINQQQKITGKVTDKSGTPLPGVSIVIKGTTTGVLTDSNGNFSLALSSDAKILTFSFVGMKSQEVEIGIQKVFNITMEEAVTGLEEVVIVGYGTQRKRDITGVVSSIPVNVLREVPVTSAPQLLQGRIAGVYVLNTGNKPGSEMTVQIRGRRSFNAGNDPLYVIDGIPISGGLNDLNPSDIESLDILKDASATAIYGSRGANGVIIVTTKRGKQGVPTVSYDAYVGVSTIMSQPDIMTGTEFAEYKRESRRSVINALGMPTYDDNNPLADKLLFEPVELESIAEGQWTNYPKLLTKNGITQNHELSVSGGSETTRYNISFGYFNDEGIIKGQDFSRYTTRVNIDQTVGKLFRLGISSLSSYSERNGQTVNPYGLALRENPLGVPYDENGNLIFFPTSDGVNSNPLSELVPGAVIDLGKRFRLLSNIFGEAQLADGLTYRLNFGPDLIQNKLDNFYGRYCNKSYLRDPSASKLEDFSFSYTLENILTYKKQLASKHGLDFTGLYGIQSSQIERTAVSVLNVPVESLGYSNLGAASTINSVGSGFSKWVILSYMARINYNYDDRFLLTMTGRADGSSKFANDQKWGYFPSVAVGWNIDQERFMSDNKYFSKLKLRLSYGKTGNTGISPYQTKSLLSRTQYDFDGTSAFGYTPTSIQNSVLRWESTASFNEGIDFEVLHSRISGSIEFYQSKTNDLLLPFVLPISTGYNSVLYNIGSKLNRGIEFSISSRNITSKQKGGFEWSTDFNLSHNHEEIVELSGGKNDDIGNKRFIGQPAVVYYDYVKLGIWQLGEEVEAASMSSKVGQIKVKDANGNGKIDPNDRQILGSDVPKIIGGMTNYFKFRSFDLSIFAFARFGSMILSPVHSGTLVSLQGRMQSYNLDYWTKTNPTNAYPQPRNDMDWPLFSETLRYFDGSFLKIRNINLGYNFSAVILQKLKVQSARVYVSAQNALVFSSYTSKYNGLDPEVDNTPNVDTPPARLFLLGINVKF